ncbi:MAG: CAP domain-containing protein [Pseudomonadota bacterium]
MSKSGPFAKIVSVIVLVLLSGCTFDSLDPLAPRSTNTPAPVVVPSTTNAGHLINQLRAANNAPLVTSNGTLRVAAAQQAALMAKHRKMAHTTGFGTSFARRMKRAGVTGASGENIASGYRTVEKVLESWMASPPHRKIMLNPRFSKFGMAVKLNERDNRPYWALVMGT